VLERPGSCSEQKHTVTASLATAAICQNGVVCRLYALDRTPPVNDRRQTDAVWRPPGIVFTLPAFDSTLSDVGSKPTVLKSPACRGRMQKSHRRGEASGRRREVSFRRLKALGRQTQIVNFEIGGLQSPSQGLHTPAQTLRSITSLDHSSDRCVRLVGHTRHRTRRARAPPGK
jgi:hypothetical protein